MLKSYAELRKLDVSKYCDTRKAKDDDGKVIDIAYLNWAKCVDLLHENGAETVYFVPLTNSEGSFVFKHMETQSKEKSDGVGRKGGCYFVKVEIHIDDKVYIMDFPLMNGAYVVYDDTLNQLRVSNAHTRAFVKGVAIHTGLGFSLWADSEEDKAVTDDLNIHNIYSIKKRVEQLVTAKIAAGLSKQEMLTQLKISEKTFDSFMSSYEKLFAFENAIKKL